MDKQAHEQVIDDRVTRELEALFPNGEGRVGARVVEKALRNVAAAAFAEGQSYALMSLLTVEDVAQQLGISSRRVRAIARARHARLGVGWQIPNTRAWLFRPEEVELLRPASAGRPRRSPPTG